MALAAGAGLAGRPQRHAADPGHPQWGRVTPFDPKPLEQSAQAPNPFNLNAQKRSAMIDELVRMSAELDDRKKVVAEYWADGPQSELPPATGTCSPSGCRAAGASRSTPTPRRGLDPLPAGHLLDPPFPAYTSGHSTFSGAAAAFMKDFGAVQGRDGDVFGATVTVRAGNSRFEPGITPSRDVVLGWPSFTAAAHEAGISRRYGGIHWSIDDLPARDNGKKIGESAFSIAKKLWEGG